MERISDFKVDKQYKCNGGNHTHTCVYVGQHEAVMLYPVTGRCTFAQAPHLWKEYKPPLTITKYVAIYRVKNTGEIKFSRSLYETIETARVHVEDNNIYWELIEIVPVTWTEKQDV